MKLHYKISISRAFYASKNQNLLGGFAPKPPCSLHGHTFSQLRPNCFNSEFLANALNKQQASNKCHPLINAAFLPQNAVLIRILTIM